MEDVKAFNDYSKWEEKVTFDSFETPDFPIYCLPNILRDMSMSVADVTQTAIDASAVAILSMVSTAAAKKFNIRLTEGDGWTEKNNLYIVIAMPSGERKSAVFSHLVKPIFDYEREIQNKGYTKSEDGTDHKRIQRFVTDDVTPAMLAELLEQNHERIALLTTEGGIFDTLGYKDYGRPPNLDVFLKGFSGDRMIVDRKNSPSIVLDDPTLTICIFVQPSALHGLPARLTGRGFMGRILYSVPPSTRGFRDMKLKSISTKVSQAYRETIRQLMQFDTVEPIPLTLSPQALEVFQVYRAEFEMRLKDGGELSHDFLRTWTERFPGQLLRIASLFHVVLQATQGTLNQTSMNKAISAETINNVIGLSDYFIEHAKSAFGCLKSDESLEDAKYLLDVLKRKNIFYYKRQQLWSSTKGKFNNAGMFDRALEVLEGRGFIKVEVVSSGRGRHGKVIECNPKMFKESVNIEPNVISNVIPLPKEREHNSKEDNNG